MNVSVIYANITKLLLYYFQISYLFSDILLTLKDEHENVASNRIREIAKELLRITLAVKTTSMIENLNETHLWNEIFA
uniref:Uncharacterized protein n=1 Tax=Ascaris lumbricoides TaxID=6252 RepID=A0A0M3IF42_ASCLU